MAAPTPLPKFVYKLTSTPPPDPLPEEYPLSELDQKDGFIHLSTAVQVPITARLFFSGEAELWVIKIRLEGFAEKTTWDAEAGPGCPHLYGNFGRWDVEGVRSVVKAEGKEGWEGALDAVVKEGWLQ